MKGNWPTTVALALVTMTGSAQAQSPQVTEVSFPSGGFTIQGRFFSSATEPIATFLLLPGSDFDPTDVLNLGRLLWARDVNMVTFAPRGTRGSEGSVAISNFIDDIGAALVWLRTEGGRAFRIDPDRIAIGGYSLGGGIAIAYAARDSAVGGVISIAGNDLGEYARRLRSDSTLAAGLRGRLAGMSTADPGPMIQEILDNEAVFGHTENATRLADRAILLIGGWDDPIAPMETVVLPFYRALRREPKSDVTIIAYQDDHSFEASREEMASDIRAWLVRRFPR